jgi:hypothetical protein
MKSVALTLTDRVVWLPDRIKKEIAMATLKERRHSDRQRQARWRQRQRQEGRKQVTAMISLKAQIILKREKKRTGESNSEVIERAILLLTEQRRTAES